MSKDFLMVKQVDFVIAVRRIKILGIAITVGLVVIYLFGLTVAGDNRKENFETINFLSVILLIVFIVLAFSSNKMLLKKVNLSNFLTAYFNAYIIPYALIDFGALFCISTNLFVNGMIFYASIGMILSVFSMIYLFPKEQYFEKLKTDSIKSGLMPEVKDKA